MTTKKLPCMSENDSCPLPKPCRYKRELDAGLRTLEWVVGKCSEIKLREEGWVNISLEQRQSTQ